MEGVIIMAVVRIGGEVVRMANNGNPKPRDRENTKPIRETQAEEKERLARGRPVTEEIIDILNRIEGNLDILLGK